MEPWIDLVTRMVTWNRHAILVLIVWNVLLTVAFITHLVRR